MDTLTHALSGALIARVLPPSRDHPLSPRAALAAGAAAAAFPDIDIVLRLADTLTYLNHHQGLTHSLLLWPVWAGLLALLFALASRWRYSWRAFLPLALAGIAVHILADLITAYGVQLFAPFSARRYAWDVSFPLDPGFTGILVAGLILSWRWPTQRALPRAALAALVLYVGAAAALRQQALDLAQNFAQTHTATRVYALPQPPTPFHWLLVVAAQDGYHVARVNLGARTVRAAAPDAPTVARYLAGFHPPAQLDWQRHTRPGGKTAEPSLARAAWEAPALAPVREFMRLPALDGIFDERGATCARFVDLRFTLPGLTPSFRYGACRDEASAPWRLQRWHGDFYID